MRFKLFSFLERYNALLITISSILITFFAIYIYNFFPQEYEGFLAYFMGIVYAFIFFLVGIYQNTMQKKLENKYEIFKEQFENFRQYQMYFPKNRNTMEVILHLVSTDRIHNENAEVEVIDTTYIKYYNWFDKLENYISNKQINLERYLEKELDNYENKNSIKPEHIFLRDQVINPNRIFNFKKDIKIYIEKKYDLTLREKEEFTQNLIEKTKEYFFTKSGVEYVIKNLIYTVLIKFYSKQLTKNMDRILNLFGIRVINDIKTKNQSINTINQIEDSLRDIKYTVEDLCEHIDELDYDVKGNLKL